MTDDMKPGIYRHFKGKEYEVLFVAIHSETLDEYVVYRCLYDNPKGKYWIRPRSLFEEMVKTEKGYVSRFSFISDHCDEDH